MSTTRHRTPARPNDDSHDAHAPFRMHADEAKVLNLRHIPGDTSAEALLAQGIVRVDRATAFGNPFPIGKRYGGRVEVIERFREHLWGRIRSGDLPLEEIAALDGKPLACWCHPQPCHAEVLAGAARWAAEQLEKSCATP